MDHKTDNIDKDLILIIDDEESNLQLLCSILTEYKKSIATNGTEGLQLIKKLSPDLILLDIMMPEIDGLEVCKQIKCDPSISEIPIIFITSKNQSSDIVEALKIGAVDYISKPFNREELLARIKTHIELKKMRDLIKNQNLKLKELYSDKSNFLSIATHDLKNTIMVIHGFAKLLKNHISEYSQDNILEISQDIFLGTETMINIINNLVLVSELEDNKIKLHPEQINLRALTNEIISNFSESIQTKNLIINIDYQTKNWKTISDISLLNICLQNLVSNAIKFSPFNAEIKIRIYNNIVEDKNHGFVIEIQDQGPGIKKDEIPLLFKKFSKLSSISTNNETTVGLGLAITKMVSRLLKGEILYDTNYFKGSRFILRIPLTLN